MACVTLYDDQRKLARAREIREYLAPFGIWYEHWDLAGRVGPDASDEDILQAYQPEIERLKRKGGYVTADVINVMPDTPGLTEMLEKFNKEHTHDEDEVRFTVKGHGVFHLHPFGAPVFAILVESGDLINVPAGTRHWFDLCDDRTIRCIRLFREPTGWTPHYIKDGVHENYTPVCWGPDYFPPQASDSDPVVKL